MSFKRLSKFGLPLTGVLCAMGALVFLALVEVAPVEPVSRPGEEAAVVWPSQAEARVAVSRYAAPQVPAGIPRGIPKPARRRVTVPPRKPLTRKARAAQGLVRQLQRTPRLSDRLGLLEKRIASFKTPEPVLALLEGLLESPLKGTPYEVQALRLAALGHIGRLKLPAGEAVLVGRLDGEVPRPERLVAIELLRGRQAGRAELAQLAQRDHDPRVQKRAQWALGQ